ncbi:MAG TPA: ABC transporter permease [Gaiellaceae bacterium]|nr:ABC transporter permease [Gaiellaceae bacterium]
MSQVPSTLEERAGASTTGDAARPADSNGSSRVTVIKPAPRLPRLAFSELWHYRELLGTLVWRDVVVRYKQTFLGIAWAILVPVFTAVVYIVVFGRFADFPDGGMKYQVLVLAGVLPMQYFVSALTGSSMSLAANLNLVTKVYFPRTLLPLAAVLVPFVDFLVGIPVLVACMAFYGVWPGGLEVLTAPLFMGLAVVSALGAGLFLSAINVRYRDVRYMIPVFLQVLPLLSGVMYAVQAIPEKWQWVLACNPMTAVVAGWRWAVIDGPAPDVWQTALGFGVGGALLIFGLAVFRSSEPRFADTI